MRKRKAKLITPFIMLSAGLVTSLAMYLKHYPLTKMLLILLIVLVVFYFVGDTFRFVYEKFRPEELENDEGDDVNGKEIIADDDVEEEYHPQEDEEFAATYVNEQDMQQMEFEGMDEVDSDEDATGETSEDDFQEEEYMDSEEFEES